MLLFQSADITLNNFQEQTGKNRGVPILLTGSVGRLHRTAVLNVLPVQQVGGSLPPVPLFLP